MARQAILLLSRLQPRTRLFRRYYPAHVRGLAGRSSDKTATGHGPADPSKGRPCDTQRGVKVSTSPTTVSQTARTSIAVHGVRRAVATRCHTSLSTASLSIAHALVCCDVHTCSGVVLTFFVLCHSCTVRRSPVHRHVERELVHSCTAGCRKHDVQRVASLPGDH